MSNYVVLLRGVNVGGKNILPMKELCLLLEGGGFENVKSYIQSGNIVLESPKNPERRIADLIQTHFGFTPAVVVLTESDFNLAVSNNPYSEYEGKFVHFYFCKESPTLDLEKLKGSASATEHYELNDKVFYLHAPDGIGRSKLVPKVETCLGVPATGRNLNTVRKLSELIEKT